MPLPLLAIGAGAAIGGAINAFSGASQRDQEEDRIRQAQRLLKESKTDIGERALGESRINRFYGASLTNVLNQSALASRGVINSPVVGAAAAAPIAGQQAQVLSGYNERVDTRNQNIDQKVAGLETAVPSGSVLGDFFSGAVQGGIAGSQIGSLLPGSEEVIDTTLNAATASAGPLSNPAITGPEIGSSYTDQLKAPVPQISTPQIQRETAVKTKSSPIAPSIQPAVESTVTSPANPTANYGVNLYDTGIETTQGALPASPAITASSRYSTAHTAADRSRIGLGFDPAFFGQAADAYSKAATKSLNIMGTIGGNVWDAFKTTASTMSRTFEGAR